MFFHVIEEGANDIRKLFYVYKEMVDSNLSPMQIRFRFLPRV
jgi:hypothetical protein